MLEFATCKPKGGVRDGGKEMDTGCRMLDAGFRMPDTGCQMPDARYYFLVSGIRQPVGMEKNN